jgi:D-amino-acid dehydrogenase
MAAEGTVPGAGESPSRIDAVVDAIVLGAGIVGVSVALHLALRGRSVALVDRRAPGEETSHGNAGLIERSSLYPVAFPRTLSALLPVILRRYPGAHYQWAALPGLMPWLAAYWRASSPEQLEATAQLMHPILHHTVEEHRALARLAGAEGFFREGGWLKVYRSEEAIAAERREFKLARELGLVVEEMSTDAALRLEPHLAPEFSSAVLWSDPHSVSNPGGVTKAYAAHFERLGGQVLVGDAASLEQEGRSWRVATAAGPVEAREVVVALGPWSMDVLAPIGYRLPMAVKRGYHMHYAVLGNATLTRPVLDEETGFVITPMERGIRLTTGAEFARREDPRTTTQLDRCEAVARRLFPLGERLDPEPWMGSRPIFPDSRPVIGRAGRHPGLWLAFGHQHLGFTLGPVTGRLLAELMTGETPVVDPAPFSPGRF